jgi:hypothetical protein
VSANFGECFASIHRSPTVSWTPRACNRRVARPVVEDAVGDSVLCGRRSWQQERRANPVCVKGLVARALKQ